MNNDNSAPSKIIPNTFQKPNFLVDVIMRYTTGDEYKCLDVVVRKTLGWLKSTDRIAHSQIIDLTGLSDRTVGKSMKSLCGFGLVVMVSGNDAKNRGIEYALQLDDRKVRRASLVLRDAARRDKNKNKTVKARSSSNTEVVLLSHISTHVPQQGGSDVAHQTQKPLSKAITNNNDGNVFKLYESEFGSLTPMISDAIQDAERTYPPEWIPEAMQIAVERNVRNWKFVEGILKKCKEKNIRPSLSKLEKGYADNKKRTGAKTSGILVEDDAAKLAEINRRRKQRP